jgi:hypothetical protein
MRFKEANILFVHVPKTGGTTITYSIAKELYKDKYNDKSGSFVLDLYNDNEKRVIERHKRKAHVYAYDYRNILGEDVYNNHYTFAFIRNPFEQIRSLFIQLTLMNIEQNPRFKPYKNMTFFDFVMGSGKHSMESNDVLLDQKRYVTDESGENIIVDDIFPFDYFMESVKVISDKTGIDIDTSKVLRRTPSSGHMYTPEMITKVVDKYIHVYNFYKKVKKEFEENVLSKN